MKIEYIRENNNKFLIESILPIIENIIGNNIVVKNSLLNDDYLFINLISVSQNNDYNLVITRPQIGKGLNGKTINIIISNNEQYSVYVYKFPFFNQKSLLYQESCGIINNANLKEEGKVLKLIRKVDGLNEDIISK